MSRDAQHIRYATIDWPETGITVSPSLALTGDKHVKSR